MRHLQRNADYVTNLREIELRLGEGAAFAISFATAEGQRAAAFAEASARQGGPARPAR